MNKTMVQKILLPLLIPGIACAIQWIFWEQFQPFAWFLFYPAVFFSAQFGGRWGGLAATILSILLVVFFFTEPIFKFKIINVNVLYSAAMFLIIGVLFSNLQERLDNERHKLKISEFALRKLNNELEEHATQRATELQKTEERYRHVLDTMMEGCQIIDFDWRYIYMNDSVTRQGRYKKEELLNHSMMEMYPGIEHTRLFEVMRDCMENRVVRHVENQFTFPDGSLGWFELSIQPADRGLFILSIDITERKHAEFALREASERFRQVITQVKDVIWIATLDGSKILEVNQAIEEVYGVPVSEFELDSKIWIDMVHPDDRAIAKASMDALRETGQSIAEYRIQRPDGAIRWILDRKSILYDNQNNPIQIGGTAQDITKRKQAEDELRQSNERFTELAEHISDIFWISEPITRKNLYVSPAFRSIVGQSIEDVIQLPNGFLDVILPEDRHILIEAREQENNGFETEVQYRICKPDGNIRWMRDKGSPVFDKDGNVVRIVGIARDLTDQVEAEMHLRESEEKYRLLAEELEERVRFRTEQVQDLYNNAPAGYHSLDENGIILMINQTELDWLGYSREELVGVKTFRELFTKKSQQVFDENFPHFKELGWLKDLELEIIRKDGSILNVLLNATAIRDANNNYLHSRSTITDITERKKIEDALRTSEERLNFLLAKTPAIIFTTGVTADMPITFISDSVRDILGYEPRQYLEDAGFWASLVHPDDLALAVNIGQELLKNGHALWESRVKCADGDYRWIANGVSLLRDEKGQPVEIIGYSVNINEQKLAEEALRISEAKLRQSRDELSIANLSLEKASRLKDEFLASMSHELRTPLTGILGLSEALQLNTYGTLNEKQQKTIRTIEDSGRHLLELINDILDLSKIEAGKIDMQFAPCSLGDVCMASLQLTKGMAHQKKQLVEYTPPSEPIIIHADARRLKQILVNLLSNAVKFTPRNGSLGLEVQADEVNRKIRLTIWDRGIGIKQENMQQLFVPFSQIDSRLAREYSGTGLGLSLVRHLTKLHNGGIEVESVFGEGSRFTVTLPWSLQDTTPIHHMTSNKQNQLPETEIHSGAIRPPLILIADDNEIVLQMVADFLESEKFRVVKVHNGMELLEQAAVTYPDIMLVDIQMPGMDGLETIRRIRSHKDRTLASTPMIAVTALAMSGDRERCLNAGANEYMSKPLRLGELTQAIRGILKKE